MKTSSIILSVCLSAMALCANGVRAESPKIKVLIIDGQNNHKWAETTPYLKAILEQAGVFQVDVSTTPPGKPKAPPLPKNATPEQKAAHAEALKKFQTPNPAAAAELSALWAKWRPRFADYDVIVSNYNGEDWPEEVNTAFAAFVRNGGGFVSYHAANNAFARWGDYNEMIALGGWGGRNAKSGPYLRLREGAWAKVQEPGPCGGHGPQHEFLVETFTPDHPIMKGLPAKWMHTKDELYHQLRGPANQVTVLGSSLSNVTHEREPMLMAISFGKGRVFHTTLGHYLEALNGLGFQVTLARGTEWAATGKVAQAAPKPGELTEGPNPAMREIKLKP
jgi:type 1 glutamine amidotransferase